MLTYLSFTSTINDKGNLSAIALPKDNYCDSNSCIFVSDVGVCRREKLATDTSKGIVGLLPCKWHSLC